MPFNQIAEDIVRDAIELPVPGRAGIVHVYRIPSPDIETGLFCQRVWEVGTAAAANQQVSEKTLGRLSDEEELELYDRIIGPDLLDQMKADGVSWPWLQHVGTTALIWIAASYELAEEFWGQGHQSPKAEPKQPTDRKPSAKSGRQVSTGTKKRSQPAKKAVTAGPTSSATGT